jgi:RNA polymerase sigma-70 factor, ECF subfamily
MMVSYDGEACTVCVGFSFFVGVVKPVLLECEHEGLRRRYDAGAHHAGHGTPYPYKAVDEYSNLLHTTRILLLERSYRIERMLVEERQAIARLRRGDIGGLEALVRAHQVQAVRVVYLIVRDRAAAEDIVQTAFVRVHARIHQFDPDRPFAPWFFKSLVNDALKTLAHQQRHTSLDAEIGDTLDTLADLLAAPMGDPAAAFEGTELRQQVWDAIGKLTPHQRSVVVLRYYLGMSEMEAAEALDVATSTVKSRLYDARQHLKRLLVNWRGESTHAQRQEVERHG